MNTDVEPFGTPHIASNPSLEGVPSDHSLSSRATRAPLPRSVVVWAAFAVACTASVGILWVAAPARGLVSLRTARDLRELPVASMMPSAVTTTPRIAPRDTPMARGQWQAIVIHDSGSPAGDVAALERRHLDAGLSGLGYHFVIGNGQGMEDGQVAVGFRWERQLAGAHASTAMRTPWPLRAHEAPLSANDLNRRAIAVCLIGNGDRRAFTDQQAHELLNLVRALQAELGIGSHAVFFHRELTPGYRNSDLPRGTGDPSVSGVKGQFQPEGFRAQLLP